MTKVQENANKIDNCPLTYRNSRKEKRDKKKGINEKEEKDKKMDRGGTWACDGNAYPAWSARTGRVLSALRQDPLWFEFWSFLTFLHHGIEYVERHFLWKFHKKIQRKSWSNALPKLLACIRFLYKVVHKIGPLRKFNRAREIEFSFLPFRLPSWISAYRFMMIKATQGCLRFFNLCLGT